MSGEFLLIMILRVVEPRRMSSSLGLVMIHCLMVSVVGVLVEVSMGLGAVMAISLTMVFVGTVTFHLRV
jgi:hypothetical protein